MTLTIEIPEDLAARLKAIAEAQGGTPDVYAIAAISEKMERDTSGDEAWEDNAWWSGLSQGEREAHLAELRRGIEDADVGRVKPAEEVYARLRAKYAGRGQ
ncbi:MAG TPA: hypothetical protein VK358_05055 [Longimicrobium sp.]|nr:hypothetical protein [Longimicrobium sp.]